MITQKYTRSSCQHCEKLDTVKLRYNITNNGVMQVFWWCTSCERHTPVPVEFIPHHTFERWCENGLDKEAFLQRALLNDYRKNGNVCCVCGASGVESHHFAPRSLAEYFGNEWINWPEVYLCPYHHRLWHEIVTPYMQGYNNSPIAKRILESYYQVAGI